MITNYKESNFIISISKIASSLFILVASLSLNMVFCIRTDNGIVEAFWGHDNSYYYVVQQYYMTPSPDPIDEYQIISYETKTGKYSRISKGRINFYRDPIIPGNVSRQILFIEDNQLKVINIDSKKVIIAKSFQGIWPMYIGWHPSDSAVYFTDEQGINLWNFSNENPELIIKKHEDYYCVCWSNDGSTMIYETGNGRYDGNCLYLYDIHKKNSTKIDSITNGVYEYVHFSSNDSLLTICTILMDNEKNSIKVKNLKDGSDKYLWVDTGSVQRLIRINDSSILLQKGIFNSQYSLLISQSKIDTVIKELLYIDYDTRSRSFIYSSNSKQNPVIATLDDLLK